MKTIDLQLTQRFDRVLVLYDDSNRGYFPNDYIQYNGDTSTFINSLVPYIYIKLTNPSGFIYEKIIANNTYANTVITASSTKISKPDYIFDFTTLKQEDFVCEFTDLVAVEGTWQFYYETNYYDTTSQIIEKYIDIGTELVFKETEIYRAKGLEELSRSRGVFSTVEHRNLTEFENKVFSLLVYDAYYKALITALQNNDLLNAQKMLEYLQQYRKLNPIIQ